MVVKAVRVLVADDQLTFRDAAAMIVGLTAGFEVADEVVSGEAAVARVGVGDIDIVLMDVLMPGIGGVVAANEIRRRYPEVVVVLLSTYAADDLPRTAEGELLPYLPKDALTAERLVRAWTAARKG